jgi:hypothetical protein
MNNYECIKNASIEEMAQFISYFVREGSKIPCHICRGDLHRCIEEYEPGLFRIIKKFDHTKCPEWQEWLRSNDLRLIESLKEDIKIIKNIKEKQC